MHDYDAHAGPPRTLAQRLARLNDDLQALALRLKDAIAGAVGSAAGQAVRDAVRGLLGSEKARPAHNATFEPRLERESDGWDDPDEDSWLQEEHEPAAPPAPERRASRWQDAFRSAAQAGLWWARRQPRRRPLLTTTLVALAAGGAAFVAGPALAACVSVVASVLSLLLTANSARSAFGFLGG